MQFICMYKCNSNELPRARFRIVRGGALIRDKKLAQIRISKPYKLARSKLPSKRSRTAFRLETKFCLKRNWIINEQDKLTSRHKITYIFNKIIFKYITNYKFYSVIIIVFFFCYFLFTPTHSLTRTHMHFW